MKCFEYGPEEKKGNFRLDDVAPLKSMATSFVRCHKLLFGGNKLDIRKDCFQNKSKFITEDHFLKHMNITIC